MLRLREIKRRLKENRSDDDILIDIHHIFMKEYGWIPLEEFKKIPIPTMINLLERIQEEKKHVTPIPVIVIGFAKKELARRIMRG